MITILYIVCIDKRMQITFPFDYGFTVSWKPVTISPDLQQPVEHRDNAGGSGSIPFFRDF